MKVMLGDPISISVKSGTINYMRWQMISLLDDVGKESVHKHIGACLIIMCGILCYGCLWLIMYF